MRIFARDIVKQVAAASSILPAELLGTERRRRFARPRHIAIYLTRELSGASIAKTARLFERDGSTVVEATRRVRERLAVDLEFKTFVNGLIAEITYLSP